MGEPLFTLSFDGQRRKEAKRPIETKDQRDEWQFLLEYAGFGTSDLANLCGVSRQTASGWMNKPESTLSWARFEEVTQAALKCKVDAINDGTTRRDRVWRYRIDDATGTVQQIADEITGRGEAERLERKETTSRAVALAHIYERLDEDRQLALERVALDMLIAHEREQQEELE